MIGEGGSKGNNKSVGKRGTKARGAKGIRYPCSPSRKRWILGVACIDPSRAEANALSIPPGEYARKCETQRN